MSRTLDPHQTRMIDFLKSRDGRGLLFCDAGTQKTYATLAFIKEAGYKKILVFCPKTAKQNWAKEIALAGCNPHLFTIENYEALLAERGALLIQDWECIVGDEIQKVAHWSAKQTKRFHKLKAKHRIALSGTPWKNHIWEAHSVLSWIEPGCLEDNWWLFRAKHLIQNPRIPGQILGIRDVRVIERVIERLALCISRDELEVKTAMKLPDLHSRELRFTLSLTEARIFKEIRDEALLTLQTGKKIVMSSILVALTRMRQFVDDPQVLGFTEAGSKEKKLAELLYDKRPTIIYSPFATAITRLAAFHKGLLISGARSEDERNESIRAFQANENPLMFLTDAGSEAINLTAADRVIFYSFPYTWAAIDQVTARAHRRGRVGDVERIFLIADGSIDDKLFKLVSKKSKLTAKNLMTVL